MKGDHLKKYLIQIAENVNEHTDLEDIYNQLALLDDIDESEEQENRGEVFSQEEVEKRSKEWLK